MRKIDYDTKKAILRLHESGFDIKEISEILKVSYHTAQKYSQNGGGTKVNFIIVQTEDATDFSMQINELLGKGWNLLGTTQVLADPQSPKGFRFIQTLTKRTRTPHQRADGEKPRRGRPPKLKQTILETV